MQWFLVCIAITASALTMSFVVLHNFGKVQATQQDQLQAALTAFVCTFIAQSKAILWQHLRQFLKSRCKCGRVSLGLMHVALSMVCVSLFDFRIIHVATRDSKLMRSSILFADLSSLFFAESSLGD